MGSISDRDPDFEAEITALPTENGGCKSPFFDGYRPNHDSGLGQLNDAQHEYPEREAIGPGETGRALLRLLAPELQVGRLFVGMQFTVQEGSRVVGHGTITRVLNRMLQRPGE